MMIDATIAIKPLIWRCVLCMYIHVMNSEDFVFILEPVPGMFLHLQITLNFNFYNGILSKKNESLKNTLIKR